MKKKKKIVKKKKKVAKKKIVTKKKTIKKKKVAKKKSVKKKVIKSKKKKKITKKKTVSKKAVKKKNTKSSVLKRLFDVAKKAVVGSADETGRKKKTVKKISKTKKAKKGKEVSAKRLTLKDVEKQVAALVEHGVNEGVLAYEEVAAFIKKYKLSEEDTNDLLSLLEKEDIDLVSAEELSSSVKDYERLLTQEESSSFGSGKANLESSIERVEIQKESDDDSFKEKEVVKLKSLMEVPQLNDPVKLYLKEIGKFLF